MVTRKQRTGNGSHYEAAGATLQEKPMAKTEGGFWRVAQESEEALTVALVWVYPNGTPCSPLMTLTEGDV